MSKRVAKWHWPLCGGHRQCCPGNRAAEAFYPMTKLGTGLSMERASHKGHHYSLCRVAWLFEWKHLNVIFVRLFWTSLPSLFYYFISSAQSDIKFSSASKCTTPYCAKELLSSMGTANGWKNTVCFFFVFFQNYLYPICQLLPSDRPRIALSILHQLPIWYPS